MAHRRFIEFSCGADVCIFAALALLLLPLKWIFAGFVAALVHECGHFLALRLCGVRVFRVTIGTDGAVMETEEMTDVQELICALAGPCGSVLLLSLIRFFPELGICAGVQGVFNLLPVLPLDGGRVVRSLLGMICPRWRDVIGYWIQWVAAAAVLSAGIYGLRYLGSGAMVMAVLILVKASVRKIPCKDERERVQ